MIQQLRRESDSDIKIFTGIYDTQVHVILSNYDHDTLLMFILGIGEHKLFHDHIIPSWFQNLLSYDHKKILNSEVCFGIRFEKTGLITSFRTVMLHSSLQQYVDYITWGIS